MGIFVAYYAHAPGWEPAVMRCVKSVSGRRPPSQAVGPDRGVIDVSYT